MRIWDLRLGEEVAVLEVKESDLDMKVAFSPCGSFLATTTANFFNDRVATIRICQCLLLIIRSLSRVADSYRLEGSFSTTNITSS